MKIKINDRSREVDRREYDRDVVTAKHTAFPNFHALVTAPGGYRPSIYLGGKAPKDQRELLFLTFAYNEYQKNVGDHRRVYKGDWHPVFRKEHPLLSDNVLCHVCDEPAVGSALASINGHPKQQHPLCQCHLDAAREDAGYPCSQHPDVVLPTKLSCCPKCEAEIDAAIMPTINEVR